LKGHTSRVNSIDYRHDGAKLVTASNDKKAIIWDTKLGVPMRSLSGHFAEVRCAKYSPDGKLVVTGSGPEDNTAIIWDAESGKELAKLKEHTLGINDIAFTPRGDLLATCSDDFTIKIWDLKDIIK
jgi:WD40 repeat protein